MQAPWASAPVSHAVLAQGQGCCLCQRVGIRICWLCLGQPGPALWAKGETPGDLRPHQPRARGQ